MSNNDIQAKIASEWGLWRKFIAANPLTGTWIMFAIGMALMYFVRPHLP